MVDGLAALKNELNQRYDRLEGSIQRIQEDFKAVKNDILELSWHVYRVRCQ